MAIFIKKITRTSTANVAIEAKDHDEADAIFEEWLDNDPNGDELMMHLDCCSCDRDEWIGKWDNEDDYNRCDKGCDFTIFGKSQKEELYDLYFTNKENPGKLTAFLDIPMSTVIEKLQQKNVSHILRPKGFPSEACREDARKRGTSIIWLEAEERR